MSLIRDLRGVIDREKAETGVFLTLRPPTEPMVAEATGAGQCDIDGAAPAP